MKIAVLLPDLRGGGVERMRIYLAQQFIAQGHQVDFVLMRASGDLFSYLPQDVHVIDLGADRIMGTFWPLVAYLRERRPDALLVAMWPLTVVAIVAAKASKFEGRIVVSDHVALSKSPQARTWIRRIGVSATTALAYRLADARVAVSSGVGDDLAKLSGIDRGQFDVIYNPAATDDPIKSIQSFNPIPACDKLVLSVGTLKLQKDHVTLIKAFARLPRERRCHLLILGEGDQRGDLERLVADLGLQGRVHLPGFVTNTRPYYEAADLFVLSSKWEGFGNVIVEALDCGVPVVSTDCPYGPAEILECGRYGRLVPVGNVDEMAQAIDESLVTQHDTQSLKRRAADFRASRIAAQYLNLIFPDTQVAQQ